MMVVNSTVGHITRAYFCYEQVLMLPGWLAIKRAWPQYTSKKDIQDSEAQTHSIDFDPAAPEQNSLIAMNAARNLFL